MKKIIIIIVCVLLVGATYVYFKNKGDVSYTSEVKIIETSSTTQAYTLADVAAHNNEKDCWIAINGNVYNATDFIASGKHNDKILNGCGKDATNMFNQNPKHSGGKAKDYLAKQFIGVLK